MAGAAAAGAGLSEALPRRGGDGRPAVAAPFTCALATAADEPEVAALLRRVSFPGDVRLTFEREPSPIAAGAIEGDVHQLLVARDRITGALAGVGSRSERTLFVNGRPMTVGYLSQLRVDPSCRRLRSLMAAGFAFCRQLHEAGAAAFYLTSIVADNGAARRLLIGARRRPAPQLAAVDELRTFVLSTRRRLPPPVAGLRLEPGSPGRIAEVAACLDRNLRRFQLAPRWTAADLGGGRTSAPAIDDFVVAVRDDRVVGCAAIWDQRRLRQVVVRLYSRRTALVRPVLNLVAPWLDLPALPPVGQVLALGYLSHVAVDDDRADVFAALVAAQCRRARARGLAQVAAGFVPRHPFHAVLTGLGGARTYDSTLYVAAWDEDPRPAFDGSVAQPEVALL
jgi:hypothetical protein